jgi:hypothetical protein
MPSAPLALTSAQKLANSFGSHTFTVSGTEVVITGKRGVLTYLGLTIDQGSQDAADTGEDRTVTRAGYRRSRWLGDTNGPNVSGSEATVFAYPTSSGNAQPGRPFKFVALTDKAGHPTKLVTGTLSIQGPWGHFVEHMLGDRPPQSVRFTTPDGAKMKEPILSAADLAALDD